MNRKLIQTFLIPITLLLVGLLVVFVILNISFTHEQIISAYVPISASQEQREAIIRYLGLDDPLFFRFLRYLGDFLTGNWGLSSRISKGAPVIELLAEYTPGMFEVTILPLWIGVILGRLFGRITNRSERNWSKNLIRLLSVLFTAVPIFFFGMCLQYSLGYLVDAYPVTGVKNLTYTNPPFITGSRILDSILSGQIYITVDTLIHYALPMTVLTVAITAVMTRIFSYKGVNNSYKQNTLLSHTAKTSASFGVILTYFILLDITFNLRSIGWLLVNAILRMDFFTLEGVLFVILILLSITLLISNLKFSLNGLRKKEPSKEELVETEEVEHNITGKEELMRYLKQIVKSPLSIIGIIVVIVLIVISIFPELMSGYTFEQTLSIYDLFIPYPLFPPPPPPPSLNGNYMLALILYGTQDALIFGAGTVLIGLIGGLIFGLLASKFTRRPSTITKSVMLVFYILPGIVLLMLFIMMLGTHVWVLALITGLLLIPSFTRIIVNTKFQFVPIAKKIIAYLPLFAGFAILLYASIGFLGFADPHTIQLGDLIYKGRYWIYPYYYYVPWICFWPGLTIFLIVISLFVCHEGLAKYSR